MRLGSMILLLCLSLLPGLARSKDQAPMQDLAIGIGYPDLRLRPCPRPPLVNLWNSASTPSAT